ncbi:MAG: DUF3141 domain-containing protein [Acetobacteraceae bacterium]|nr:DUF3141 domain-containing protein [Acetobacteraceae bacterium]
MPKPSSASTASFWPQTDPFSEYWIDAFQRAILFLDVLRQRGNSYFEQNARTAPNVLSFDAELVLDGRKLERPVNYGLARIIPPPGTTIDDSERPFIVFDPRAGQGPGIGGMKHDSEIGEALAAGHPCYFVGFLPNPVPGQTVEDVCRAEARFIEAVAARHPNSGRKPALIGNCQAGWQIMMACAIAPDRPGPILLAGSPLSYWAGVRGKAPMRYLGGLMGGTWLTSLAGDLGNGIFDGASLVTNFESMHPDNTYWRKAYNLYSKVDTEAPRFLEFEKWWGCPVVMNAEEMQYIADNLFVGNKLSTGQLRTSDGLRIDLRNIRSPIIVFCSWGEDITPPPQALDWILDLYEHEDEIISNGQTIVYTLNQSIGHLGIFVSGRVATKEHAEFVQCMDLIDLMPPGLYEAVITEAPQDQGNPELIQGRYLLALERRTLNDIRTLGCNDAEDDRRFATVARLSEINQGLYRSFVRPAVRAAVTPAMAETLRQMHPDRLRFSLFSDRNPFMADIGKLAESVRRDRHPVAQNNPLLAAERLASNWIETSLKLWGEARDSFVEQFFLTAYGSPLLQSLVGLNAEHGDLHRRIERDFAREAAANRAMAELESDIDRGGVVEAFVRALGYIVEPAGKVDERGFVALEEVGRMVPERRPGFARFKEILREQFLIMKLDQERAIEALPKLAKTAEDRRIVLESLKRLQAILQPKLTEEQQRRLAQVERLLAPPAVSPARREPAVAGE